MELNHLSKSRKSTKNVFWFICFFCVFFLRIIFKYRIENKTTPYWRCVLMVALAQKKKRKRRVWFYLLKRDFRQKVILYWTAECGLRLGENFRQVTECVSAITGYKKNTGDRGILSTQHYRIGRLNSGCSSARNLPI